MEQETQEPIVDVEQVYSKTEQYVEKNKNILIYSVVGVVAVIGMYFGYKNFILAPKEAEAASKIWTAEQNFEKDSFLLALNGTAVTDGFLKIADNYSGTEVGNLANYYAGICYLRTGDYQNAIKFLEEFDSDDEMLKPVAIGAVGDAYAQLGDKTKALNQYLSAAQANRNNFTTPIYLMKAGLAYEGLGDYANANKLYKSIQQDFPETNEGRNIEKYIARAELMSK